jgi:hypothetical protein
VVVIVWQLDLQLPVQSVPITTKVVISNPVHGEVYSIKYYVIKFVSCLMSCQSFYSFIIVRTSYAVNSIFIRMLELD